MIRKRNTAGLLSGAIYLTASTILVKVIGMLYKVPMSYILSDEGMGYFNAAYTVYSLLYLLGTAGVPKAITVLVSKYNAEGKEARAERVFTLASRVFFCIGACLCILLMIFAAPLSYLIGSPNATPSLIMIAPSLIFVCLGGVYRGYLTAYKEFSCCAIAALIEALCKLLLGLFFLFCGLQFGLPLSWLCALCVLGIAVGSFGSLIYLHVNIKLKENKDIVKQKCTFGENRSLVASIFKIAIPITVGSLAAGISSVIDLSMIMRCLENSGMTESEAAAVYGNYTTLAVPMLQMAISLVTPIAVVILPTVSSYYARKDMECFRDHMGLASELCAVISWPIAAVFFFFPYETLCILFQSDSASLCAPLLRALALGVILFSVLLLLNTALESMGRPKLQMVSMLAGILVKICVSRAFLQDQNFGIMGAPIGTVFGYGASLILSLIFVCLVKGGISAIVKKQLYPCLCSVSAILITLFIGNRFFDRGGVSRISSISILFVFCTIYLILLYFTGVFRVEKIKKLSKQPI